MTRATVIAVGLVILLTSPAEAVVRQDDDEVPGKLDLQEVEKTVTPRSDAAPAMLHMRAKTYDSWNLAECHGSDGCSFDFQFDSRRGRGQDYDAYWTTRERRDGTIVPKCLLFRIETFLAYGSAAKHHRNVFCSFPLRLLHRTHKIRWRVLSLWGTTLDRAPDHRWFE